MSRESMQYNVIKSPPPNLFLTRHRYASKTKEDQSKSFKNANQVENLTPMSSS